MVSGWITLSSQSGSGSFRKFQSLNSITSHISYYCFMEVNEQPRTCDIIYIDDAATLKDLVARLLTEKYVCIDTEFVRDETFFPQLCLIQIRSENIPAAYCIDTLAISKDSLREILVLPLFYNSTVLKIFHSASQDLEALHFLANMPEQVISPLFDTAIAWKYLSTSSSISYSSLVNHYLGVTLDQSSTRSNWLRRPLSAKQIQYAADDVIYLSQVYEIMEKDLVQRKRLEQVQKDFEIEAARYCRAPDISKGIKQVKKRGLCNSDEKRKQLYLVAAWREHMAMKYDCPRRWLLTDDQVVNIALQLAYLQEKKREPYIFFENFHRFSPVRDLSDDSLNEQLCNFINTNTLPPYTKKTEEPHEVAHNTPKSNSKEFWKEREILKKEVMSKIYDISDREQICANCLLNSKQLGQYLDGDESVVDQFRLGFLKKVLHDATCQYMRLIEQFSKDPKTQQPQGVPKPKGISKQRNRP